MPPPRRGERGRTYTETIVHGTGTHASFPDKVVKGDPGTLSSLSTDTIKGFYFPSTRRESDEIDHCMEVNTDPRIVKNSGGTTIGRLIFWQTANIH